MIPRFLSAMVLLGGIALPSLPKLHLPVALERWLYNPRERTERSITAYEEGQPREAVDRAETALRLAPEDPQVQYNAGTAYLAASNERKAIALLEKAAQDAGPGISAAAHYNLGNARLAAGDASGAIEAYKQALRTEPKNAAAKHNLELALRKEKQQNQGMQSQPKGSRGNRKPDQDPSRQPGRGNQDPNQAPPQDRQPPSPQQQGQQPRPGQGGERDERLPQFQNQPEMNAREAASVLSAVENLERQQRRDQAARQARQRAAKGKDW